MSLPAGQQRILDGIAETLRLTEPRLTAMFAIFTRLAKSEPPPRREQLADHGHVAWLAAPWHRLVGHNERGGPAWWRLLIVSPMALALIALVVLTCIASQGPAGCGSLRAPRADATSVSHQLACLAPDPTGVGVAAK
jgi:hypothetical protein